MTKATPTINPDDDELRDLLDKMLRARNQTPSTLLALWLYLPVTIRTPSGQRRYRSTLEASLASCRSLTHRDNDGRVRAGEHGGDWLGAIGYLTLLDQIGGAVERMRPPRIPSGQNDVERALAQFSSISEKEAVCLYALRNSLAHNFSLVNYPFDRTPRTRRRMTRLFALDAGGTELIKWPKHKWSPHHPNAAGGSTEVDLQVLGDVVEGTVKEMRRVYEKGDLGIRRTVQLAVWRHAHFFSHGFRISVTSPT